MKFFLLRLMVSVKVIFLGIMFLYPFFLTPKLRAIELEPSELRGTRAQKPVVVLQNRYFLKTLRPELGIFFGKFLDEAYTTTATKGVRLGLFTSEWLGFEAQYVRTSVTPTDDMRDLNSLQYREANPAPGHENDLVSPQPEINPIFSYIDADMVVAPFYGKMDMMDWFIVYSDLYMALGASQLQTWQGNKTGLVYGLGERFYVGKSWSVRIDFRDHFFVETRGGGSSSRNATNFDIGLSYFFL